MKTPPQATTSVNIKKMLPFLKESLDYCADCALELANYGGMYYDTDTDEVVYYHKIRPEDQELYPYLREFDEIWIVTGTGNES